jgi:hypothetical protein
MLTSGASDGLILQDQTTGCPTFAVDGPGTTFAQSFTAVVGRISSIGFFIWDANAFFGGLEFTVTLFAGEGTGGAVLGSRTRTLASLQPNDRPITFVDFDFSGAVLVPGQVYTAKIVSTSSRGAVCTSYFLGDVYPGGQAYRNDVPSLAPRDNVSNAQPEDMVFRVLPALQPTITLTAIPQVLWPPDHKMKPVVVVASASDGSSVAPVVCQIAAVKSSEPSAPGYPDWAITGPLTVNLRAERAGSGNGRVYTLTVTCANGSNLNDMRDVTVSVPHDQRK